MTTTTTFSGMEPGAKSSSRVLRPPGGGSNISFGTDEQPPVRKNKMASSIFDGPDDPHAHRRNNPPTGQPSGILCGEHSAPLRRCQQPLVFPKNPEPELTTITNSGAEVWGIREGQNEHNKANEESPEELEADQEQKEEAPQPSAPSGAPGASSANTTPGGRRNPPGGKSSLILG
ncbi:jupiter microtubule associated homolog 1-like [Aplochiton taeniatus]